MAYPQGINFRLTSGFVTDVAPADVETYATPYPRTTPQGNTVGWENPGVGNLRDRSTGVDARLAGVHFVSLQTDYRFDLPSAGSYNVRLAAGDMSSANNTQITLVDTTTTLATLATGTNSSAGSFKDATDTLRTAAAWPGSNASATQTFATTICRFRMAAVSTNLIAHAYVESAGGSSNTPVNPGADAVVVTGFAPTLVQTANQSVSPGADSLVITGYAPSISQPKTITAGAAAISITGYAPLVTQGLTTNIVPGAGSLVLTGYAPSIAQSANQAVAPSADALSITSYAPTLAQTANQALVPGADALVVTGYAPAVTQASTSPIVTPGACQLSITGYAPSVTQSGAQVSGGYFEVPQVQRRRSVKEERERLGIIPREVKQIVQAVARASVVADKTDAQAEQQLAARLAQQDIDTKSRYTQFMQQERERIRTRDIARALLFKAQQQADDEDEESAVEMLLL